jgi:predicted branched-subunit amino acid permease
VRGTTAKSVFWRGFLDGLPFVLTAAPFGLLFGLVGTEAGLNLFETMSMAVLVIAGAAQFTALAQMQDAAPVALVIAAGLAVNLRLAIYSAALAPHLGPAPFWQRAVAAYILVDNAYATAIAEFEREPDQPVARKMAYYFAAALPVWIAWYAATLAGALLNRGFPPEWGLDFAVPIAFLAILGPMLRTLAHVVAVLVSLVTVLLLQPMPFNTELLVAALLAMIAGAEVERRRGA